ncbi:uncharacterized protein OCT59_029803 [Rhizophagus irregularis]|uniref:uncharacterized protein n=1 Tax=Rhizophagus irregularis TaxID=588596 RepID=UPI0033312E97|nr:hypothetical protein OCT59_029803 [Rhizophagus irregularis]
MIANITTIVYILSVTDETINNGVLQKAMAISRIDNEDAFQIYKFYNYMTLINNTDLDSDDGSEVTSPLKAENVYLITGKFSTTQDGSINVSITTNVQLLIDKEDIPIIKPTVHLLGKTLGYAELTESGYTLQIQNALTKARKNSTVHTTGVFFFAKDQLYCEILEFQFVSAKIESDNSIVVPWKSKSDSCNEGSSKSVIEQRISLIQQNSTTQPSLSMTPTKNKRKTNMTKIADISRSLLLQNQQSDEIHDSETSITNEENEEKINEKIEENEERNENIKKKNNTPKISNSTRGRKKQKTK